MAIIIETKSYADNSKEREAAQILKERFSDELKGTCAKGHILIASSVQIFGQEVRDIDLVVIGSLSGLKLNLKTKYENRYSIPLGPKEIDVEIKDFCIILELKNQSPNNLYHDSFGNLFARYPDGVRNVTEQSEKQKYALKNFITQNSNQRPPLIINMIWTKQVDDYSQIKDMTSNNLLISHFSFKDMIEKAISSDEKFLPKETSNGYVLSSSAINLNKIDNLFNYFREEKKRIGNITAQKIHQITTDIIDQQIAKIDTAKDITLLQGKAGTGKTSKILRLAYKLQKDENARCLILTYNKALVGDIKRLLAFSDVSDQLDFRTVSIQTMQSFFVQLMKGFADDLDIVFNNNFEKEYAEGLKKLFEYINANIINEDDIANKKLQVPGLSWDYVFIDEGQDWQDEEKKILMKFYNQGHLIVADGIDQIVRGTLPQNWLSDLKKEQFEKNFSMVCLRQKNNLVSFSKDFAEELGLKWDISEAPKGMGGGNVFIRKGALKEPYVKSLVNLCTSAGNEAYDLVFFVPPCLVNKEEKVCELKKDFESWDIPVFDGTNVSERDGYAKTSQVRLYQYDSCRGLEGWVAVAVNLDDFVEYKMNDYAKHDVENPNVLNSFEDRRRSYIHRWLMMIITRPIDTLVITIRNPNSKIAGILRKIANLNPEFVNCSIDN